MFVIKYDKVSMIRLVQCIEKQPAIYDVKTHYSKEEQDSAWDKVAIAVGEKANLNTQSPCYSYGEKLKFNIRLIFEYVSMNIDSLCRDRWHSIKSCYIRHLKYTALNSKRKPYYLAEFLGFLLPHVTDRIKAFLSSKQFELDSLPSYLKEALPKPEPITYFKAGMSNGQKLVIKEEIVDVEEVSDSEWLRVAPEIISQPSSSKNVIKRLPPKCVTNATSSKKVKTLKVENPSKSKPSEDDDVKFFKSLLPEVTRMSSHQKLKFKQEALSIIEDILYATEEVEDLNIMD